MVSDDSEDTLIEGLEAAIANDRIVPWFQPVMDPLGVRMLSAEALPRWDDPIRGVIPAGVFISLAMHHGMLGDISRILMTKACANFAGWRARAIAPPVISVNLTGHELRSPVAVARIGAAIDASGMRADQFAIEIAERVLYEDGWEENLAAIDSLQAHGIRFWLDDFGSDALDPAHLSRVPFALAKVDRQIVGNLDTDASMVSQLKDLVAEARARGIGIIAKGVETREQIDILMATGCDGQQGFAIARPMPEDSFAEWLDLNTRTGDAAATG